jgi:predicted pyridoxine 5'-phosphate oxidase superfamily flavin-nucleotide-binding protein
MALVTFGFLIGVRFDVLMLIVAIGLAVVGTSTVGIAQGNRVEATLLTVALVATALQIGYLFGLITRAATASLRKRLGPTFVTPARWPDLAGRGRGQSEALLRDIQTTIGQELRAKYELPQDLPPRMLALLMQASDQHCEHSSATQTAN